MAAWNWTSEVARLGHDATVLVSPAHRTAILAATQQDPALQRIRWLFPEVAPWPLEQGKEPGWERTYNLLWQREALRVARAARAAVRSRASSDLEGVRAPTFLGALGVPLIIGPVGGGETLADVRGGRRAAARDRAQALARYRVEFDRRGRQVVQPLENPATHWETVTQLATSSSLIAVACLLRAGNAGWLTNR